MELNFELHPGQLQIFESPARFKVCAAGRRFGKTFLSRVELLVHGLQEQNKYGYDIKDKEIWYVAPTYQQARDIMWSSLKEAARDVTASTLENTSTLTLINGRTIKLKGSDRPDTLRGPGLSKVVLDEYAFMKPNVWEEIIFPTLTECKGEALFIGTPDGKNHFHALWQKAQQEDEAWQDWESFYFKSIDNPILPKELLIQARNIMSRNSYLVEFEASFEGSNSGLITDEMLIMDSKEPSDGEFYVAVDPSGYEDKESIIKAHTSKLDDTAIAVVKVHSKGWWVKDIESGRWNVRETALRMLRQCQKSNARILGVEDGALKAAIMPYLNEYCRKLNFYPRIEGLKHGGKRKVDRITWALQGRMEHDSVRFNPGLYFDKFRGQALDFPNPLVKDDMLDALAYIEQLGAPSFESDYLDQLSTWAPFDKVAGY